MLPTFVIYNRNNMTVRGDRKIASFPFAFLSFFE